MKRVVLLLVLCALILPRAGWAITPKEFDNQTIPLMGKPKEADKLLKICMAALTEVESDMEFESFIYLMKSHAHLMKGEYDKAEKDARAVIMFGRLEDLGHSALRDVFFARQLFEEGLAVCLEGVSRVRGERNQASARQDCQDFYLQATSVTPAALWDAYKKNPALAKKKYKEDPVKVLGEVASVKPSDNGQTRVVFALDKGGSKNVVCIFGGVQAAEIPAASPPAKQLGGDKDAGKEKASSTTPASSKDNKSDGGKTQPADGLAYSLSEGKTDAKGGKTSAAPAASSAKEASVQPSPVKEIPVKAEPPAPVPPTHPTSPSAAEKPTQATAVLELPEVGEIVVISGRVRGMEANNLVLVNCEKIR